MRMSKLFHSLLLLHLNISQSGYLSRIRIVFNLEQAISGQSTESEFQSMSIEKPLEKSFHSINKAIDWAPKVQDVKMLQ